MKHGNETCVWDRYDMLSDSKNWGLYLFIDKSWCSEYEHTGYLELKPLTSNILVGWLKYSRDLSPKYFWV